MERQRLTAFFELRDTADHAIREMVALGVPAGDITLSDGHAPPDEDGERSTGVLGTIKDAFMPEHDRRGHTDGHPRTGHVLSVVVDAARHDRVRDLLTRDGATMVMAAP